MAGDILEQLKAVDLAVLTEVVRKDQHNPELKILDWTVKPISHEKIIDTTGGLFRFSGQGRSTRGIEPWTVVLKCINDPKQWGQQPGEWAYWRREILVFQSDLLEQLPAGIRAPRCYGVMERENEAWVWIEHIHESTGKQWSLETFQRTARHLGRFQGTYLTGTQLPDHAWLSGPFFRSIWAEGDFWSGFMNPSSENNAWKSPIVQRAFNDRLKQRVLRLLDEKQVFFDANESLPQVLCHNDANRRNFMWSYSPQTGQEELVGIDWAFTGTGAVGNDLGELVGTSLYFFDYDPYDHGTLEAAILEGYLSGIADSGAVIDPRLVRLGYLLSLSFWWGASLAGWTAIMLPEDSGINVRAMYGHTAEEVLAGWVQLAEFYLDRVDEARSLIKQLGL
jgi:hypothetical protein